MHYMADHTTNFYAPKWNETICLKALGVATWWICTCTLESPVDPYETGLFCQPSFLQLCEHQVFLTYVNIARYFPTPDAGKLHCLPSTIYYHIRVVQVKSNLTSASARERVFCMAVYSWGRVEWAKKQQAANNHTCKLRVHSLCAVKLILQPKVSTHFQIKILQIF